MERYQIQKSDRNGDFDDVFRAAFASKAEAVQMATHWSACNPNCAWGVRVLDTLDGPLVWED